MSDMEFQVVEGLGEEEVAGYVVGDVFDSDETKEELATYLQEELTEVLEGPERSELEERWDTWRRHRVAMPKEKVKNTPWMGAANTASPITGSNTNGIYARVKNHIKRRTPLITVEGDGPTMQSHAESLGRFVNKLMESPLHINFMKEFNGICYDTVSLGTQFVEVPWKTKKWQFKRSGGAEGLGAEQVDKVVYDGPVVEAPRIEDFITRVHWHDIQTAPWVAFRSRWYAYELEHLAALGYFENLEKLEGAETMELEEGVKKESERMGLSPVLTDRNKEYTLYRVYVFWDSDGNGVTEDLILWYEKESNTILRAEFNELGRRPIVRFPYFAMPKMLYAIGVGWMSEQTQEVIDTLTNIRLNSTHLSSVQMTFSRRGSGLPKKFLVAPAANHETDDPEKDVRPFTFPDVSDSTVQAEMIARSSLDRFTGGGEAAMGLGDSQAKSRATASGQMFLAERSDSILSSIIEDIEEAVAEVALFVVMQLVANGERAKEFLLPIVDEADKALVEEVLDMKVEDIPLAFRFQVKVTDEEKTQEAKRQGILMLTRLYSMFGQELMQNMMLILDPQVPEPLKEFATRIYVGRTKLMEETLKMFGEPGTSSFVPYTRDLEFMLSMVDSMKEEQLAQGIGMIGGAGGGAQGIMGGGPVAEGEGAGGGEAGAGPYEEPGTF